LGSFCVNQDRSVIIGTLFQGSENDFKDVHVLASEKKNRKLHTYTKSVKKEKIAIATSSIIFKIYLGGVNGYLLKS